MTRRVRFTPRTAAGLLAASLLARPSAAPAAEIPFVAAPPITTAALAVTGVLSADLDRDGDLDVLPVAAGDDLTWRENAAGDASAWTTRTITTALGAASTLGLSDLDRDGDTDVIASLQGTGVAWIENASGDGATWAVHPIATSAEPARSLAAADLDRDGDADLVATFEGPPGLAWFERVGAAWVRHSISTGPEPGRVALVADVDRDGDPDVMASFDGASSLRWYRNPGDGSAWTRHTVAAGAPAAVAAADFDRDGDDDLVGPAPGGGMRWYENPRGAGRKWPVHAFAAGLGGVAAVSSADLDGDGDSDVLAAGAGGGAWLENAASGTAWTLRPLGTDVAAERAAVAADLDGDGDADAVTVAPATGVVRWHRNETIHSAACFVPRYPVTSFAFDAWNADAADVDGDGDADVLSASSRDDMIAWYPNLPGDGSAFTARLLSTLMLDARGVHAADVDGDGQTDVVGASFGLGLLVWWENLGSGLGFAPHLVQDLPYGPRALLSADVDGDGDRDLLSATYEDDRLLWFENLGNGLTWAQHTITDNANGVWAAHAADVDRDGDVDVLSASVVDTKAAWFENAAGDGSVWVEHRISTAANGIRTIRTADVDGDGDLDALATTDGTSSFVWYENVGGAGAAWVTRTIATGLFLPYAAAAADVDGDGDQDLLATGLTSGAVTLYENADGSGGSWPPRAIFTGGGFGLRSLVSADLDRDGDLEVLFTTQFLARVDLLDNRRGQFTFGASGTAPTVASDGALVGMLRLDARNLGRAGDHDAEMSVLGLLLEEDGNRPYETVQVNSVVESLRVYRDADGNGVFEPSTDVLVAMVPTLTLDAGVQTIAFADGDPDVRVPAGPPRTYFVAVEFTANASQQSPSRLRVSLTGVGPFASRAEDRDRDLPLRMTCPANVASGFVQVLPVARDWSVEPIAE